MKFDHEKLDVYRVSIEFVAWSYRLAKTLKGADRHARDQLLRASQSIPLNIAEGNGKRPGPDRIRFLHFAYGSALECAAILDVLQTCQVIGQDHSCFGKNLLHRIVAMLIRMTQNRSLVKEPPEPFGKAKLEFEFEYGYECESPKQALHPRHQTLERESVVT